METINLTEKLLEAKAMEVAAFMEADFKAYCTRCYDETFEDSMWAKEENHNRWKVTFEKGRNFFRFVRDGSCNGFLVINPPKGIDNKTGEGFNRGDLLMAKSWKAPAKNFARGNVLDEGWEKNVRWTGVL
ncbi:hypothetical protein [Winogradskyella sp.]|uniref:hypothetical protein n=1 Tax=Winogradskyella sp. TaxID=1883156 RepID=UPI00351679B9